MRWRVAKSLVVLRSQIDALYPDRNKASDGTIGDIAHQAGPSDHNPDANGVVAAIDITHDPAHGLDIQALGDALRGSQDPRIKYIIANRQICVPSEYGWNWVHYLGDDPHTNHLHLSVNSYNYDETQAWDLNKLGENMRRAIPPEIVSQHFENYSNGHLKVSANDPAAQNRFEDPEDDEFWYGLCHALLDVIKSQDAELAKAKQGNYKPVGQLYEEAK